MYVISDYIMFTNYVKNLELFISEGVHDETINLSKLRRLNAEIKRIKAFIQLEILNKK